MIENNHNNIIIKKSAKADPPTMGPVIKRAAQRMLHLKAEFGRRIPKSKKKVNKLVHCWRHDHHRLIPYALFLSL